MLITQRPNRFWCLTLIQIPTQIQMHGLTLPPHTLE